MGERIQGFITERHLDQAESDFPGITRFFCECAQKPSTFLELVWRYESAQRQICSGAVANPDSYRVAA